MYTDTKGLATAQVTAAMAALARASLPCQHLAHQPQPTCPHWSNPQLHILTLRFLDTGGSRAVSYKQAQTQHERIQGLPLQTANDAPVLVRLTLAPCHHSGEQMHENYSQHRVWFCFYSLYIFKNCVFVCVRAMHVHLCSGD